MNYDRLTELISRKLTGEATAGELEELDVYLRDNPDDQFFTELLSSYWNSPVHDPADSTTDSDEHFNHILQMADETISSTPGSIIDFHPPQARRKLLHWVGKIAAAVIIIIIGAGLTWVLTVYKKAKKPLAQINNPNEVIAKRGTRTKMLLPDGTMVMLNSETKLKHGSFSDTVREVFLDGEAFFEVVKDSSRPFIVHTSGIDIKVLGTSFNVKAYPGDKQTEASLIRGSIEVTIKNRSEDKIILSPSEKLVVINQESDTTTNKENNQPLKPEIAIQRLKYNSVDSSLNEIQWVGNKLVFNDESFAEVAIKMKRWYNVEIEIADDRLKEKRLTGNFDKENIDQALEALMITNPFSYEKKGNKIIIHR